MLYTKIIGLYSEKHNEHMSALQSQNLDLFNVPVVGGTNSKYFNLLTYFMDYILAFA